MSMSESISQMTSAITVDNGTLLEVATPDQNSASGYTTEKMSVAQLADHCATGVNYPTLQTTAKDLVGAINELESGGGGGGSTGRNFSTTKHKVGTWVDGKDIWEQTYIFSYTDFHNATLDSSVQKGQFWLDITTYEMMWLDQSASFLMNTVRTGTAVKSHPLNFGSSGGVYTRANIQRTDTSNNGNPFVYYENTYSASAWYNIISDWRWVITVQWTEATTP